MSAKKKTTRKAEIKAQVSGKDRQIKAVSRAEARTEWPVIAILAILLVGVTAAVYWQVSSCEFVRWDDPFYVTENSNVQGGISSSGVVWAFTTSFFANWHPLTWLSHMLDCQLFGLKPAGHHLTSLVFHIANVLLLFWVLIRMTGSVWKSGFVAALFAVHPLQVESVAWVSERKDVLSAFFWLLTMLAYTRYAERPRFRRYILVLLAFALGLMAKPMLVSLPIMLLLLDYWPLKRLSPTDGLRALKPLVIEKMPLFALSAASSAITLKVQATGGAVSSLQSCGFGLRAANAVMSYTAYLAKAIWPSGLACFYPYVKSYPGWQVASSATLLAGLFCLAIIVGARYRFLAIGWLWYVITLVPVIGLVQVGAQCRADRYTYIPLIGLFIIVAWGVPALVARLARTAHASQWTASVALSLVALVVLSAFAVCAKSQVRYWRNSCDLWTRALEVTKNNDFAHNNLANILLKQGNFEQAVYHYSEALAINPRNAEAHNSYGAALDQQGKLDQAIVQYREALKINPKYAKAHVNLGLALGKQNTLDEAVKEFAEAIRIEPGYAEAHLKLATVLYLKGDYAGSWEEVRLVRKYGGSPPPDLLRALQQKMLDPARSAAPDGTRKR